MKKIRSLFCVLLMALTIVWAVPFTSHAQMNAASDLRWLSDPGNFAFALNNTTGYVQVKLINRDSSFPYVVRSSAEISKFESDTGSFNFAKNIRDDGRYYVVVTVSESKDFSNGVDAISPDFNYTKSAELPTPTNLRWSTSKKAVAEWDITGSVAGYDVQLYEDGEHLISHLSYRNPNGNVTSHDFTKYISDDTTKEYSFRVSALSPNIQVAAHSQFSYVSEIYDPSKVVIEEETKPEDDKTDQNISGNDNQQQTPEASKEETDNQKQDAGQGDQKQDTDQGDQKQDADTGNTDTTSPTPEETSENQTGSDTDKNTETTVTKITLSKKSASLKKGNTLALKATVKPADAKAKLTWKSSNSKVASVDKNGKVKALKKELLP
jgi:hypothetical protein